MASQAGQGGPGGLKHAATEPSHLDNKREGRRRGAAGRAAVLRRAPSDSDCSGETASLSADSADRVRPAPPVTRQTKTRSRRRGSEWEVLEGLKDGQRFERRPEVFNGYLHKKRKWPLKGWHKRFFVVDGGILVYARSPTDVARGRLHGSVDVGLSVISAKARRRRIDIDADEFIYHLRAKTPDVFRTWLNVLKAHRLYRQHLLTFGARESVPKIHAPLEDLPPTDNSSPISYSSDSLSPKDSRDALLRLLEQPDTPSAFTTSISCYNNAPIYYNTDTNPINSWYNNETDGNELVPLDFESLVNDDIDMDEDEGIAPDLCNHSLCSMNCVAKRYQQYFEAVKPEVISPGISEAEKQINSTELDRSTPEIINLLSPINCSHDNDRSIEPVFPVIYEPYPIKLKVDNVKNTHAFNTNNNPEMTALFFFTKKKKSARCSVSDSPMKKSKKSTNVVKYKNVSDEPPLKRPTSIGMLLNNYHNKATARSDHSCEALQDNEVQATEHITKVHKLVQDPFIPAGYEKNIERLIMTILESKENCAEASNCVSIKDYVNQMVIEMQDLKLSQAEIHPVKILLKYLLEYWLKNAIPVSSSHKCARSVDIPSNIYFTRDKNESSCFVNRDHKQTQIQNLENFVEILPKTQIISHSFVKDRRIQELERVLKNTVYTFENASHHQSKEKDIEMTKKLIHNLDKQRSTSEIKKVHSDPSLEFPKIQETFDNLIRETSISPEVAKEFLDAYLHVLQNDSDRTSSQNNSSSTDEFKEIPSCAVQTESVVRRVSKKVSTGRRNKNEKNCQTRQNMVDSGQDPGQMYLKDILDKITTIFSKPQTHIIEQTTQNLKSPQEERKKKQEFSDNLRKNIHIDSSLISENVENNSVVIDLTKYDVEHISMMSDPAIKGVMSITIKLKERPQNMDESQEKNLNIKFSGDLQSSIKCKKTQELLYKSSKTKAVDQRISFKNPYIDFDKDKIELKPFMSSSDATSKAYRNIYENQSDNTLRSDKNSEGNVTLKKSIEGHDDLQSCFIMSNVKTTLSSIFQPKKKVRVQEAKTNCNPCKETSVSHMRRGEHSLSEKIAPKAIDEQFILLLLENLTLLSVNMPVLHKDISCLYSKLKKRHEKERRPGKAGVGLLGQIYKVKSTDDNETQFETHNVAERTVPTQCSSEKAINTDPHIINVFNRADKTTSIVVFMNTGIDFITQTDRLSSPIKSYNTKLDDTMVDVNPQEDNVQAAPEIVRKSKREWFDCISKKSTIGALFKCILDNKGSCQNFRFVTDEIGRAKPSFRTTSMGSESSCQNFKIVYCAQSRKASPVKLEKTMPKSGWSKLKQEIQQATQTERKIKKILRDLKVKREYNVYQLFVSSKFRTSTSLSGSNIAEWSDDMNTIYRCTSEPSYTSGLISPTSPPLRGPQAGFVAGTPGGRLASWIIESGGPLENATRELGQAQLSVQQLQRLLDALELLQHHHDTDQVSLEGASPNVKKDRRKFGLRKKKSNSKCASVELAPPLHVDGSTSHMALSALTAPPSPGGGASSMPNSAASLPIACAAARPQSLPGAEALAAGGGPASISSLTPDQQLREDFTVLAKDLLATLKGIVSTLVCERGRLRAAMESAETASTPGGGVVAALRTNLSSALQQNSELRSRLSRIHDASDLAEISSVNNSDPVCRQFPQSLSYSSSCVSASEFFDAEEHDPPADLLPADETGVIELDGDSSSEAGSLSSEDGSASSDNSDGAMLPAETESLALNQNGVEETGWTRRTRLPCPRPTPGGPSLWNLLYKNIGKDLSQVSMPVTINEPLNMLQRLCEELEYSALLDTAAACRQGMERMSLMAAFAVSAYAAAAHRAASKPFNPLLHETYECTRPDRAFRFLAEQVSHHPPISACHAESPNWCFWQEARIKTKFWGKSMEFQPAGRVHVRLLPAGDHYSWNKVTTCVHNLFGGQRWVDQYGDMHIVCHDSDISCKLQFIKASSWSSSRHEIRGWVTDGSTGSRLRLHGRWSEALYAGDPPAARCLWRPGAMPPDHELYYGFTRFAMELNEMEPGLKELLPHTDTRFRPDQRALEEGDVEAAEQFKHELEQSQRERRRDLPDPPCWFRKSAEGGEEMWVFTGEYWKAREAGFPAHSAPRLW